MRGGQDFLDGRYSRVHRVLFDGGVEIEGSPSPSVVRAPMSSESGVDPEEAFVASLSACHMLTFLHEAQKAGFRVDHYVDHAEGELGKNAEGRWAADARGPAPGRQLPRRPRAGRPGAGGAAPQGARGLLHRQFGAHRRPGGAAMTAISPTPRSTSASPRLPRP
jgi:hypothetical protein